MKRSLPLLAPALLALGSAGAARAQDAPPPAPSERTTIAGLKAIMSVSTLTYASQPDRPHELVAMYAFPDRCKWRISLIGGSAHDRQLEYRSGAECWRIDPSSNESRSMNDRERSEQTRRMELRRALLLWPDGFEWQREGPSARAELGALGYVTATLGDDDLPLLLESFDTEGNPSERFDQLVWSPPSPEQNERALPAQMRLSIEGAPVWTERFTEIALRAQFLDWMFVPPDRLEHLDQLPVEVRRHTSALQLKLPERTVLRTPLEPGLPWPVALERARDLRAQAQRNLSGGRPLAPGLELELTPGGRPVAVLIALAEAPDEPPLGWDTAPAQRALALDLAAFPKAPEGGLGAVLEALRAELPRSQATAPARLALAPPTQGGDPRRLRILVPLAE